MKVSADVLLHGFGYFVIPGIIFACWYPFKEPEEAKHKMLEQKYGNSIREARAGRQNMQVTNLCCGFIVVRRKYIIR